MSDHLTEEEQLENLKRLWKEYGMTIITSVVVAGAGYFGWNYWQDQQRSKAETASAFYDQLLTTAAQPPAADGETQARSATLAHLVEQIKAVDADSGYALEAALFRAADAVKQQDYAVAKTELQWVLDTSEDQGIAAIARLRLARVLAAEGNYDEGLALLADAPVQGFIAEHAEVRGDLLRLKGDNTAAVSAYQQALDNLPSSNQQQRSYLLQMKIDDLKTSGSEEPSA